MDELHVLHGFCTIQLFRKIGGSNAHPDTIVWEVCGNTLVDECNFQTLNQYRWLMARDIRNKSYYLRRIERIGGKRVDIILAREILGLPRSPGFGGDVGDHKNHDTLDNTLENLRVATSVLSVINRRKYGSSQRFKGIIKVKDKYVASIWVKELGLKIYFPSIQNDIEAGLMHFYASAIIHGEFICIEGFPGNELPTEERQQELWEIVNRKLELFGVIQA